MSSSRRRPHGHRDHSRRRCLGHRRRSRRRHVAVRTATAGVHVAVVSPSARLPEPLPAPPPRSPQAFMSPSRRRPQGHRGHSRRRHSRRRHLGHRGRSCRRRVAVRTGTAITHGAATTVTAGVQVAIVSPSARAPLVLPAPSPRAPRASAASSPRAPGTVNSRSACFRGTVISCVRGAVASRFRRVCISRSAGFRGTVASRSRRLHLALPRHRHLAIRCGHLVPRRLPRHRHLVLSATSPRALGDVTSCSRRRNLVLSAPSPRAPHASATPSPRDPGAVDSVAVSSRSARFCAVHRRALKVFVATLAVLSASTARLEVSRNFFHDRVRDRCRCRWRTAVGAQSREQLDRGQRELALKKFPGLRSTALRWVARDGVCWVRAKPSVTESEFPLRPSAPIAGVVRRGHRRHRDGVRGQARTPRDMVGVRPRKASGGDPAGHAKFSEQQE